MQPKLETRGEQTETGWRDHDGFIGPVQPGNGPRSDPRGDFPTGPEVGQPMPDLRCQTAEAENVDLHQHRAGRPAIFIFFRSAVW